MQLAIEATILSMRERDGLLPAQIADALGMQEEAVVLCLAKKPSVVKGDDIVRGKMIGMQERAAEVMGELMETAESESVKLESAKYIIDTARGLKEVKLQETPSGVSLSQISELLAQVERRYKESTREIIIDAT